VRSLSATIKAIDESNLEDEALFCVPSRESPYISKFKLDFEKGVKEKVEWLRQKLKEYGSLGHMAYDTDGKVLGFIEFICSKGAPLPIEEGETTAIITCIDLHAPHGQGIGTNLLKATLRQLWKIGICQVKTLVSRSPNG